MSQNTLFESSTSSSPNPSLHPVLQAALGSLDIQLEDELARYRRQRAGRPVMPPRGFRRHQTRKPLDLISLETPGGQTQQRALGMSTAPVMSFPLGMGNQTPAAEPFNETERLDAHLSASSEPSQGLVVPSAKAAADPAGTEPNVTKRRESAEGDLVSLGADQSPPEDYLESSEKLLESLSEQEEPVQPQKPNRLLTPLGIGSILLLLLSSATVIYLATNRSTFTALGLDRVFGSNTPNTSPSAVETTEAKSESAKNSPVATGPNLASEEFPDLNLNTLSHFPASPTPLASPSAVPRVPELPNSGTTSVAPAVIPNSALPKRSSDLSSTLLPPSVRSGTVPSTTAPLMGTGSSALGVKTPKSGPTTSTGKLQASPASPQTAANPGATGEGFYYVLVNDSSDRALEKVKTVVPDAYVESFPQGARIQLGAFKRESEAKALVKELQQRGVAATIYRP